MPDEPAGFGITHDEDVQVFVDFGASEGTYDVTVRRGGQEVEKLAGLTHDDFQTRLHASEHVDVHPADVPTAPEPGEDPKPPAPPADTIPPPVAEPPVGTTPPPPASEPAVPPPRPDSATGQLFAWLRKVWARITGS